MKKLLAIALTLALLLGFALPAMAAESETSISHVLPDGFDCVEDFIASQRPLPALVLNQSATASDTPAVFTFTPRASGQYYIASTSAVWVLDYDFTTVRTNQLEGWRGDRGLRTLQAGQIYYIIVLEQADVAVTQGSLFQRLVVHPVEDMLDFLLGLYMVTLFFFPLLPITLAAALVSIIVIPTHGFFTNLIDIIRIAFS